MDQSINLIHGDADFWNFLYDDRGLDFRHYSPNSLRRRLHFCMQRLKVSDLGALRGKIQSDPAATTVLLDCLTINTTEFFRNPAFFLDFRNSIVPILKTYYHPRVWIAGCSTGEEILSYAIILKEEGLLDRTIIYATDLNIQNLRRAKNRIYSLEKMEEAGQAYSRSGGRSSLDEYFHASGENVIFSGGLISNVTFADHCLATDFSFSEFHFISCRHVLMYFNRHLQDRVLRLFSDSLVNLGVLGVGSVEDMRYGDGGLLFEPFGRPGYYQRRRDRIKENAWV